MSPLVLKMSQRACISVELHQNFLVLKRDSFVAYRIEPIRVVYRRVLS